MKYTRFVLLLLVPALLATACDSRSLMEAMLGPGPAVQQSPQPVIVTATPLPATVVIVTPTPAADAVVEPQDLRTNAVNLRYGPGTVYAPPTATLARGTLLTVLGKNGNFSGRELWLKVRALSGQEGWIAAWLLTVNIDVNTLPILPAPPTPTPLPPTLTPTPAGPMINFYADKLTLAPAECTTIRWDVQNVKAVFFQGAPTTGQGSSVQCPTASTTYQLSVVYTNDVEVFYTLTLVVGTSSYVNFRADRYGIGPTECTTIRWDVSGVSAVYFQGVGVTGSGSQFVCPGVTSTYNLRVVNTDSSTSDYYVTLYVDSAYGP